MKLCNFYINGEIHVGALCERGLIDVTAAGISTDMVGVIKSADISMTLIAAMCGEESIAPLDPGSVRYANVTAAGKIACVGLNYRSHAEETGGTAPEEPVLFSKFNDALAAHGDEVKLPEWLRCYDYEAELVIVIGKHAWNVPIDAAEDKIFGYCCGNDLSARDSQFRSGQWLIGKSLPGFAPAGPYIVPKSAFDPEKSNKIECRVNGEIVQHGDTSDMIFTCREIVSYASRFFPLEPGDLIFTGTPAGVILGKPKGTRVWLRAGDTVEVEIEGIGTLKNTLIEA